MKPRIHSLAIVIGLFSIATQITGCGGGGGGTGNESTFIPQEVTLDKDYAAYLINPDATWEDRQPGDYNVTSVASINLSNLNNGQPFTSLEIRSYGSFYYDDSLKIASSAAGLLVDSSGNYLSPANGSSSSLHPISIQGTCGQQNANDSIPEDFFIPSDSPATLVLPPEAKYLFLSVVDCYFHDNKPYPTDPIRVTVTAK